MSASVDAISAALYGPGQPGGRGEEITAVAVLLLIALLITNELLRVAGGRLARRWIRALSPSIAALSLSLAVNMTIRLLGFL
jgi:hypothetical protein